MCERARCHPRLPPEADPAFPSPLCSGAGRVLPVGPYWAQCHCPLRLLDIGLGLSQPPAASQGTSGTPEPPTWRLLVCEEPATPAGTGLGLVRLWGLLSAWICIFIALLVETPRPMHPAKTPHAAFGSCTLLPFPHVSCGHGQPPRPAGCCPLWARPVSAHSVGGHQGAGDPGSSPQCPAAPMMQGWLQPCGPRQAPTHCLCLFFKK